MLCNNIQGFDPSYTEMKLTVISLGNCKNVCAFHLRERNFCQLWNEFTYRQIKVKWNSNGVMGMPFHSCLLLYLCHPLALLMCYRVQVHIFRWENDLGAIIWVMLQIVTCLLVSNHVHVCRFSDEHRIFVLAMYEMFRGTCLRMWIGKSLRGYFTLCYCPLLGQ
jgi:hypothetical protein